MTFVCKAWVETAASAQMHCVVCKCSLTGGVDTFGALHAPQCQSCWLRHGGVTGIDFGNKEKPKAYTIKFNEGDING